MELHSYFDFCILRHLQRTWLFLTRDQLRLWRNHRAITLDSVRLFHRAVRLSRDNSGHFLPDPLTLTQPRIEQAAIHARFYQGRRAPKYIHTLRSIAVHFSKAIPWRTPGAQVAPSKFTAHRQRNDPSAMPAHPKKILPSEHSRMLQGAPFGMAQPLWCQRAACIAWPSRNFSSTKKILSAAVCAPPCHRHRERPKKKGRST